MQFFVKPLPAADGSERVIFMPNAGRTRLPPEGAQVPYSSYWLQLEREGAVSIGAEAQTAGDTQPARPSKKSKSEE